MVMEPHDGAAIECLLAENNPTEVRLVQGALPAVPLPIRLHVADDGAQALAFLRRQGTYAAAPRPDLVILALSLPQRRGEDILATLTRDPLLQSIPVFVALEFVGERVRVRRQGFSSAHYLLKPLTARQLLRVFRHSSLQDRVSDTLRAVQATLTRAQVAIDLTRQLQREREEFRQARRAWAERKAEQHSRPRSDSPPPPRPSHLRGPSISSLLPAVDFLQTADFLREELQKFFRAVRRGEDKEALLHVTEQLRHALSRCEPLVRDPEQRDSLSTEQRWGFLLLLSSVQSAREALKQV
jgi:two-component system, chemotaxis family, response regulator Rcp1